MWAGLKTAVDAYFDSRFTFHQSWAFKKVVTY